ncbi:hypothetical protein GRI97_08855 [Altererythrobacter xixiisoli]|uniref:Uncharacterized protein n=1 Tax=Croceibacterium xixiisoli TaxID=1476466 RepID=A0A6I4TT13_9SPHN|nr:hypothetical protein [Croceibacterium xixiisoli]MXO99096.1 hypothetical protein [Croceibacterium xixiisoli]
MTPNRIFWGVMGLIGAIAASVLLADAIGKSTDSVLLVTLFGALIAGFARIVLRPYWDRIMAEGFLGAFDVADADDVDIKSPFGSDVTTLFLGLLLIFAGGLAMPWQPHFPLALSGGAMIGWQVGGLFYRGEREDDAGT